MTLDTDTLWKLGVTIALALGLKDLVASMLRATARHIREAVRKSPSTFDDAPGAVVAGMMEMAAEAAIRGDLAKVKDFVAAAAALPATKVVKPLPDPDRTPLPVRR